MNNMPQVNNDWGAFVLHTRDFLQYTQPTVQGLNDMANAVQFLGNDFGNLGQQFSNMGTSIHNALANTPIIGGILQVLGIFPGGGFDQYPNMGISQGVKKNPA